MLLFVTVSLTPSIGKMFEDSKWVLPIAKPP